MSSFLRTSERPTLPPIHTLDLPMPDLTEVPAKSTYGQGSSRSYTPRSRYTHAFRKASTSSSNTSASRSPSPVSSSSSSSCMPYPPALHYTTSHMTPSGQVRLVPCSLQEANAIILAPPASDPASAVPVKGAKPGQSLLLIGSAMQQYVRQPARDVSKSARMHPYKIVPVSNNGSLSRRSSVASMVSLPA